MASARPLQFTFSDRIGEKEISPAAIPLGLLKQFTDEVAKFLAGSQREIDAASLPVSIIEGSLVLETESLPEELGVWSDVARLSAEDSLHLLDPARAKVVRIWQRRAQAHPARRYGIRGLTGSESVLITAMSHYRDGGEESWFRTERYLHGKVLDLGGQAPNLHLRLPDGSTVTVEATEPQLRDEQQNHIYHDVLLRVSVEEHLQTGARRKARLIEFVPYKPAFDKESFELFVQRGTDAWSSVTDPVSWVRGERGN